MNGNVAQLSIARVELDKLRKQVAELEKIRQGMFQMFCLVLAACGNKVVVPAEIGAELPPPAELQIKNRVTSTGSMEVWLAKIKGGTPQRSKLILPHGTRRRDASEADTAESD